MKSKNNKKIVLLFIILILCTQQASTFAWFSDWKASTQNISTALKNIAESTKEHLFGLPTTQKIVYGGLFALGIITLPALYVWQPWQKKPISQNSTENKKPLMPTFDNRSIGTLLNMVFEYVRTTKTPCIIKLEISRNKKKTDGLLTSFIKSDNPNTDNKPLFQQEWVKVTTNNDDDRITGFMQNLDKTLRKYIEFEVIEKTDKGDD